MREADNERLTRVGPGTPMGRLIREYWIPCLLSAELPEPGCAPVRVLLLCETLVAFRDSSGRVGLLEEHCPHRRASLFFGRNEGTGLRCAYHGWKFDVTGRCIETPTEPEECGLMGRVRAQAYPCVERGGVVWAYLGSRDTPPPLPDLEPNLEGSCGEVQCSLIENNWLQSIEGDIDISHVPILHADNIETLDSVVRIGPTGSPVVPAPSSSFHRHIEVADTPAGFAFAVRLPQAEGRLPAVVQSRSTWSAGHFMFPFYANLPYGALGSYWLVARVPLDDYHTMTFGMWQRNVPQPARELMFGSDPSFLPNTGDGLGRFRLTRHRRNDFLLDRAQARGGGSGISGQAVQDGAITTSMGAIVDRTREHLVKSDIAIIHLRRRLLAALSGLERGEIPAVDEPGAYRVKQGTFAVTGGAEWHEVLRRRGGAGLISANASRA